MTQTDLINFFSQKGTNPSELVYRNDLQRSNNSSDSDSYRYIIGNYNSIEYD